jgi:predicted MFS family arabinose efflux permease
MHGLLRSQVTPILLVAVALLLAAMTALAAATFSLLTREVVPALQDNARVIANSVGDRIEYAVDLGIPLDRLVAVPEFLDATLADSRGVAGIAVVDMAGQTLYAAGVDLPAPQPPSAADAGPGAQPARPLAALLPDHDQLMAALGLGSVGGPAVDVVALPIVQSGVEIGGVRIGIDRLYVARQLEQTAFDIAVVMGVALLLALETLLLVMSTAINGPLTQIAQLARAIADRDFRQQAVPRGGPVARATIAAANAQVARLNALAADLRGRVSAPARADHGEPAQVEHWTARVGRFAPQGARQAIANTQLMGARTAAFLFVLAEELSRPFLPLYIRGFEATGGVIDGALQIAVPLSAFMLFMALAGPVASGWSDRVGRRRTFLTGALISTIGLAGTALAVGFADLVLWRSLSGVGYALTFVACQGHVLDQTSESDRTRGLSVFVGGIMAADICGPAIGGILADRIGYSNTLLVAAGVAVFAGALAVKLMEDRPRAAGATTDVGAMLAGLRAYLKNRRLLALTALAAVPAKMMLTGFLFFLAPLILTDLGAKDGEIGRLAMIYGVSAMLLMPLFASLCDRFQGHGAMIGVGAILTGCGLIPMLFGASTLLVAIAILALGVGQAMSVSAQTALVTIIGREEIARHGPGPVMGAFRLLERIGAALGPLVAGQLAQMYGFVGSATVFGYAGVVTGVAFSALFLSIGVRPEALDPPARPDAPKAAP